MKTHFHPSVCPHCGKTYDSLLSACPHCLKSSEDPASRKFDQFVVLPFWRQILLFFLGWMGFQVIALVVSEILYLQGADPSWGEAELEAFLSSAPYLGPLHFIAYAVLFLALSLCLWDGWKKTLKSFASAKGYLWGLAAFAAQYAFGIVYGILLQVILAALGMEYAPNANQGTLDVIIQGYPVLSLLIFGFVGPFCEELTYRVGLFSFAGRFGKVVAYVGSALVFALIHFDFEAFGNPEALAVEFYNLPSYLFAGLSLGFAYDKGGFAGGFVAHALNNCLSVFASMGE